MKICKQYIIEIMLGLFLGALLFWWLMSVDALEFIYKFSRAHEDWELDELIMLLPVAFLLLAVFAMLRLRDLRVRAKELRETNEKLQAAQREIHSLLHAREKFMAMAYHELKGSLGGVLNAIQLIELADNDEERKEFLDLAKNAGNGLRVYADDIVEVTRLVSGHATDEPKRFSPFELIKGVASALQVEANQKHLQLRIDVDQHVPQTLVSYAGIIRHIVRNLVENAIKYTQEGYVEVVVSMNSESENSMVITVCDTGKGIPVEMHDTVFEPYVQVSERDGAKGVGLGLSIVRQLIDIVQGEIHVRNNTECPGTVFEVLFPVLPNGLISDESKVVDKEDS